MRRNAGEGQHALAQSSSPASRQGCPGKILRLNKRGNRPNNFVLAGLGRLGPAINAFEEPKQRRGCADQVRARRLGVIWRATFFIWVHRGRGVSATEFGPISYEPGDWVLLPKATTFRQLPEAGDSLLLVVESPQPIRLCEHEQVGRHTPIDPTMLEVPDVADYGWPKQDEYEVRLKHAGGHSSIFYRNDPMKVVGWKGDLFPFKLNVRNILPIMSDRIHVPPSSWVTFEAPGFVVLSIFPQVAVADLQAEELPSYHRNIDMDEVMLSKADEDASGRRPGNFRHTPQGILHGANEAYRAEFQARRKPGMRRTSTLLGVDAYRPLRPAPEFLRTAG
jgi:homogentisate 1,2-dioxygenase